MNNFCYKIPVLHCKSNVKTLLLFLKLGIIRILLYLLIIFLLLFFFFWNWNNAVSIGGMNCNSSQFFNTRHKKVIFKFVASDLKKLPIKLD